MDTRHLIWEEKLLLDYLKDNYGKSVKLWTMINYAARHLGKREHKKKRPMLVALTSRLLKEKKIIRHRKTNFVRISEHLV